eukprot:CAMPEP_0119546894 /NCGR_PEP_ID=MMETSP1352-20130426/1131_1 /TAXON_ID=265584 /ORGANISM="Stauroneis constricta, Strain CCMP1120" /LENGTH=155 /DNA_ID=CAMNT_0007591647 /DNA_START=47 /DNA_END=510 /DNA_ORIENTATION=+
MAAKKKGKNQKLALLLLAFCAFLQIANYSFVSKPLQYVQEHKVEYDHPTTQQVSSTAPQPIALKDVWVDRFIVVPEYKLLFCYMEKVGGSMFNHLFRMLRILHPDISGSEASLQAGHLWFRNTPHRHKKSLADLENIFKDPEWTKAVFYRDPIKR